MAALPKKVDVEVWADSLKKEFFNLVRCSTEEETLKASRDFQRYLDSQSRDLSSETVQKFFTDVNYQISVLIKGNTAEKIAALVATRALLKSEVEGYIGNKIVQLGVYVRDCSLHPDIRVMKMAVHCLKTLASMEGTLAAEFVEEEIRRAFASLEAQSEPSSARGQADLTSVRRHSAVLCLEVLAKNSPTLFFVHIGPFFNLIWVGLCDKQITVRESSAAALHAVLYLIGMRRSPSIKDWYKHLYQRAKNGLDCQSSNIPVEPLHGTSKLVKRFGVLWRMMCTVSTPSCT